MTVFQDLAVAEAIFKAQVGFAVISCFDHVFSSIRDNDLDATLARFVRAGFLIDPRKMRRLRGRLTAAAHLTGPYLEFLSAVDQAAFQREATMEERFYRLHP